MKRHVFVMLLIKITALKGDITLKYVYHLVPNSMLGEKLIPLNQIKEIDAQLYEKYMDKYNNSPDRKLLLERKVPKLNCRWNDVVHFSPLHPNHIYQAMKELNVNVPDEVKFYKIPIENLQGNENAIYYYNQKYYGGPSAPISPSNIDLLKIDDYEELDKIPKETFDYFQRESNKRNRFGMFHLVPHILSMGQVSIENAEVISWNE